MNARQPTRAERDRPAALRASEDARNLWWQAQARQAQSPLRCISCGAKVPSQLEEGQGLPCGH